MPASLVLLVSGFLGVASQAPGRSAGAQPRRDYATFNVCQAVPGDTIARALGGKLAETRPFGDKSFSRCTYFVVLPATGQRLGYVVWMQPPEDFEELKKSIEEPRTTLTGLGDGAYMFHDKGDGRFKINVLKRGDLMFQATGETAESARKVADAVVAQLWKAASPPRLVERRVIGSEPRNGVPHADAAVPAGPRIVMICRSGRMAEMLPLIAHA